MFKTQLVRKGQKITKCQNPAKDLFIKIPLKSFCFKKLNFFKQFTIKNPPNLWLIKGGQGLRLEHIIM